ncbi:MAG: aspartokinase/homoserine dehydrogenase 1, partial [Marivirga sp.]
MQVLKFGGTSVGSPENIQLVKAIVLEKAKKDKVTVVVSAFQGITNKLILCAKKAAEGDKSYQNLLKEIAGQHNSTAKSLLTAKESTAVFQELSKLLAELEDILKGVFLVNEISPQSADKISCYGEILSAHIISAYLAESNVTTRQLNPKEFIRTDSQHGKANVDFKTTDALITAYFKEAEQVNICPGFLAADAKGKTTTLGRGGSDYTAAIIAAAVGVEALEIWTDVSGMMTANPQYVKSAYAISEMSYEEAMELTHFGAKVLYPPAIQPVLKKGIPVLIKNTFAKDDAGTKIYATQKKASQLITGLSSIEHIALINLSGTSMVGIPYFSHRLFQTLSVAKVSVVLITQASSEHSICVAINEEDLPAAEEAITHTFAYELEQGFIDPLGIETGLAIVALVGANMKDQIGVSGSMLSILGSNGVSVKAIAQGSSEKNISVVIKKDQVKKSLNALHESFFLSEKKRVNLFIVGTGNVGKALLDQLRQQHPYLEKKHHLDVRIVGIANSKKMLFEEEGIDLNDPMKAL